MSILTVQRIPSQVSLGGGLGAGYINHPFSRTMRSQYAMDKVNSAMAQSGNWMQTATLPRAGFRGLGAITDGLPAWAPWAIGGAVAAGVVGWFVFRKKRR